MTPAEMDAAQTAVSRRYLRRRLYGEVGFCASLFLAVVLLLFGMATLILADWGPQRQGVECVE